MANIGPPPNRTPTVVLFPDSIYSMKQGRVYILGTSKSTSAKHAERYVVERRARWANDRKTAIEFISDDSRHLAALASEVDSETGYDHCDASMTARKLRAVPVINPNMLLYGH